MIKTYTIRQGNHYCEPTIADIPLHFGFSKTNLHFRFRFHDDCIYDESLTIPGWNKLFGWSSLGIHANSVRVSWDCRNGKLWTGYYCYKDGIRYDGDLKQVEPNQWYEAWCIASNGDYTVRVEDSFHIIAGNKKPCLAFKCFPFFGGQSICPHDMNVEIEIL